MPTETCHAIVDLDNSNCKLPCDNMEITLTQHITLTSKHGHKKHVSREVKSADFPGLDKGESTAGQK